MNEARTAGRRAAKPLTLVAVMAAWACILAQVAIVCAPLATGLDKYGGHDWDATLAFRYFVVKSFRTFHQFPFWLPNCGGGYTAWGFIDSDTIVVSPWLPLYFLLDVRVAARLEVVGTALLAAWGTWLLAGCFTRSVAGRALACILFVVNGRWAMQTTAGHIWHCYYVWMPWALYFYERSHGCGPNGKASWKDAAACGGFLALMIYNGAIYPLPHTLLAIAIYSVYLALTFRRLAPIYMGAVAGASFIGLAAPRLFPILDAFGKAPRLIESNETMDLSVLFEALTNRNQDFGVGPVRVSQWGWHEWGMYIGWVPILLLIIGTALPAKPRARGMKLVGAIFFILAFGSFHEYAPWKLLHEVPVFRSLHVPSRWLYPASLLLGVVTAAGLGRLVSRARRAAGVVDLMAVVAIGWCAIDIAQVSNLSMRHAFWMQTDPQLESASGGFRQVQKVARPLLYEQSDWSTPLLPAIVANVGVIESTAVAPVGVFSRDASGKIPGQGAKGQGDPSYRGEFFTQSGAGKVNVTRWTPGSVTVSVEGATPGDLLVMNQNYDPGWQIGGVAAINYFDTVATTIGKPSQTFTFDYRPRSLTSGILAFLATIFVFAIFGTNLGPYLARQLRRFSALVPAKRSPFDVGRDAGRQLPIGLREPTEHARVPPTTKAG
jgi:hypothetical protein